ncbi:hypothetical protein NY2A_b005L [Paramecium bursaria Chlorella virus NY2A]|uniref:Uncharacterized protein b005L n=1 Tax=Paramecium bursaria Chlorella virus NY2A TaxID=46021 RepID=A7IVN0_PBCVN|nr:hypothetical protein NY2A_b005L [Paramecium bursaria Chlorella virus NY2A]ABT14404.1 hypothetical protein NY2A_b005L [Paramecium bursaria Chlorella virus NY2A]
MSHASAVSHIVALPMMSSIKNLFTNDKPFVVDTVEPIECVAAGPSNGSVFESVKRFFTEHVGLYRVGTVFVVNTPETIEIVD